MTFDRRLRAGQGAFDLAAGAWPLIDRASVERATGPKTEFWLVRTVGSLLSVMGVAMLVAARERHAGAAPRIMAGGTAAALAAVDVVYVGSRRISPVYFADAGVQVALAMLWAATALPRREGRLEILGSDAAGDEA